MSEEIKKVKLVDTTGSQVYPEIDPADKGSGGSEYIGKFISAQDPENPYKLLLQITVDGVSYIGADAVQLLVDYFNEHNEVLPNMFFSLSTSELGIPGASEVMCVYLNMFAIISTDPLYVMYAFDPLQIELEVEPGNKQSIKVAFTQTESPGGVTFEQTAGTNLNDMTEVGTIAFDTTNNVYTVSLYNSVQDAEAGQAVKTGAGVYKYFMGESIVSGKPQESIVKYIPFLYQDEDSTITEKAWLTIAGSEYRYNRIPSNSSTYIRSCLKLSGTGYMYPKGNKTNNTSGTFMVITAYIWQDGFVEIEKRASSMLVEMTWSQSLDGWRSDRPVDDIYEAFSIGTPVMLKFVGSAEYAGIKPDTIFNICYFNKFMEPQEEGDPILKYEWATARDFAEQMTHTATSGEYLIAGY